MECGGKRRRDTALGWVFRWEEGSAKSTKETKLRHLLSCLSCFSWILILLRNPSGGRHTGRLACLRKRRGAVASRRTCMFALFVELTA